MSEKKVTVLCDRCNKRISGVYDPDSGVTGGFYRVGGNPKANSWAKYRRPGEKVLCDNCMWRDKGYIKDQGGSPLDHEVK